MSYPVRSLKEAIDLIACVSIPFCARVLASESLAFFGRPIVCDAEELANAGRGYPVQKTESRLIFARQVAAGATTASCLLLGVHLAEVLGREKLSRGILVEVAGSVSSQKASG